MKQETRNKKRNKKGFTLVEMIVVIAIIGVLAAMMVPSLLGFVDKANTSNNNTTAAGVGRAAQALLIEYTSANKTVTAKADGYTAIDTDEDTKIQFTIDNGYSPDTKAFLTEMNTLIAGDKFPKGSGLAIIIGDSNQLTKIVFNKTGAASTSTSTPSKTHGVYLP